MSDIRKIQTGNNQYTLHARVSDKLAVSAQIGSTTKPVYVDSSGQVQACTNNMAVSETIAPNTDLNTYKTPGFYNAGGSSQIVNTPTSNSDGLGLLVIHDTNGQFYTQIAFPHTGGVYRRNCSNDVWENWVKIEDFTTTYKTKLDGIAAGANKTIVDTGLDKSSTNPVQNKVINEELSKKADKSQLSSYVTTATANNTYAKKSDISAVYKYKDSRTYSALPTSGNVIGDVYNITTADATNGVKAGDNVVWDGSKWDNLSGTVDLSNYLQKGGSQTTTSTADGGSNVYTFKDGSTITVKNGSKGSTGAAATWFSGGAVTGTSTTAKTFPVSGSKAGDMYLNTGTSNVYKATAANQWVYLCNIKGPQGTPGNNGTTPTIKAAAGANINTVGTPTVSANTSGTTTTFTFNNLKGQKGDTGATVTWHTGTAVTGTAATVAGVKTGDMYLNTKTCNVYKSTGTNKWVGVCNIKGANGSNGTTPTIKAAAGGSINSVGTPTVSATTNGTTTTFTFNNLKGQKGETGATGATVTWHTGTAISKAGIYAIANAKLGDMYLNTTTCDVFRASSQQQTALNWMHVCNIKGAKGDAADIPKLGVGVAGIVPGPIAPPESNPKRNKYMWLNAGSAGAGVWQALPTIVYDGAGQGKVAKSYTQSVAISTIQGRGTASTKPTIQKITEGANDYRAVESDASGLLFVNVPAYEKNANTAQNTVLAAPTSGAGTATFRKLTTSDIPWNEKFKVMTPAQYKTATKLTNVFYFILEE